MKKILIATDGSASAAEAVAFGIELAAEHSRTGGGSGGDQLRDVIGRPRPLR